jgi:ABC-type microcin C transport system permease subunit YejB
MKNEYVKVKRVTLNKIIFKHTIKNCIILLLIVSNIIFGAMFFNSNKDLESCEIRGLKPLETTNIKDYKERPIVVSFKDLEPLPKELQKNVDMFNFGG